MPETSSEILILGIDPGSIKTGFGLIRISPARRVEHVAHGTIVLKPQLALPERLRDLALDLQVLVLKYRPTLAVVEDVFVFKNARSALVLGQARGAIQAVLGLHNIPTFSLSPTEVKAKICGRGHALKFQVAQMVALQLNIEPPKSIDASDALAIALAKALTNDSHKRS